MEKYRPTPRQWFADPKLPAGASGTKDLELLRGLRSCAEKLWACAEGCMISVGTLERSFYPAGSRVTGVKLGGEARNQSAVDIALERLTQIENEVLDLSLAMTRIKNEFSLRELHRAHNRSLRALGQKEIDGCGAEDEDLL